VDPRALKELALVLAFKQRCLHKFGMIPHTKFKVSVDAFPAFLFLREMVLRVNHSPSEIFGVPAIFNVQEPVVSRLIGIDGRAGTYDVGYHHLVQVVPFLGKVGLH
jgi:hypothetical protein